MILNQADNIMHVNQEVQKVFLGAELIWERKKKQYDETKITVIRLDENMQKTSDIHYTDTVNEAKTFINANSENLYHVHIGERSQAVPTLNGNLSEAVNLYSIDIPEGVEKISSGAFDWCTALHSVDIPNSVTEIERGAFSYCLDLQSVHLGTGITKIGVNGDGDGAFSHCESLTEIYIPGNVKTLGGYRDVDGTFTYCSSLTSVVISEGTETIGGAAFELCRNLSHVELPDGLKKIGGNAFYQCESLTEIFLPDSIDELGAKYGNGLYETTGYVFFGCTNLKSVHLPAHLREIYSSTFHGCESLKTVSLPEKLEFIGDSAFYMCENLRQITIPDSVKYILDAAFAWCTNLSEINLPDELKILGTGGDNILPYTVFYNCTSLTGIAIPTNIKTLRGGSFSGCTNLTAVTVHNQRYSIASDPWGAPNFISTAYAEQLAAQGKSIPEGKHVVHWAGAGGGDEEKLAEMALLKEIDSNGLVVSYSVSKNFSGIRSILSENSDKTFVVELGDGFNIDAWEYSNVVPADCFAGLTNVKSIYIPQRFRTIEENAFSGCTGLEFVHIDKQKGEISGEPWGTPAETVIYYSASLATNAGEEMINTKSVPFAVRTTGTDSAFDTELSGILLTNTEPEEPAENTLYLLKESSAFKLELNGKELKL